MFRVFITKFPLLQRPTDVVVVNGFSSINIWLSTYEISDERTLFLCASWKMLQFSFDVISLRQCEIKSFVGKQSIQHIRDTLVLMHSPQINMYVEWYGFYDTENNRGKIENQQTYCISGLKTLSCRFVCECLRRPSVFRSNTFQMRHLRCHSSLALNRSVLSGWFWFNLISYSWQ